MKKLILPLLVTIVAFCGCAHQYVIKLSNGTELIAPSKPHLKGANYHYKDARGQDVAIPQSRVMQIQPTSMAAEEKKLEQAKYAKPKNHWWQFWR
jgi:hypothetical protein